MPSQISTQFNYWSNWVVELVELGGNPLRLHCMPAWSNWVVELSGNPLTLHCMPAWSNWASFRGFSPNSTRHHLNGFPPNLINLTRHHLNELGGNPLELHCMPAWSNQSLSQWISTQFDQASSR